MSQRQRVDVVRAPLRADTTAAPAPVPSRPLSVRAPGWRSPKQSADMASGARAVSVDLAGLCAAFSSFEDSLHRHEQRSAGKLAATRPDDTEAAVPCAHSCNQSDGLPRVLSQLSPLAMEGSTRTVSHSGSPPSNWEKSADSCGSTKCEETSMARGDSLRNPSGQWASPWLPVSRPMLTRHVSPGAMARKPAPAEAARLQERELMDAWYDRVLRSSPKGALHGHSLNRKTSRREISCMSEAENDEPAVRRQVCPLPEHTARPMLAGSLQSPPASPEKALPSPERSACAKAPSPTLAADDAPEPSVEQAVARFRLDVSLSGDALGALDFHLGEDVEAKCEAFVAERRLRSVFLAPLMTHLELMVHVAKHRDSIEVLDLI